MVVDEPAISVSQNNEDQIVDRGYDDHHSNHEMKPISPSIPKSQLDLNNGDSDSFDEDKLNDIANFRPEGESRLENQHDGNAESSTFQQVGI